jgi:hypothetical protein
MKLKEILDKNLFWVFLTLCFLMIFTVLFSNKIVNYTIEKHYDQIADAVVKKLQKQYSPSPYGPGIDPDKIDVEAMVKPKNTEWEQAWGEYRSKDQ